MNTNHRNSYREKTSVGFVFTLIGLLFVFPSLSAQEESEDEEGKLPELGVYIQSGEGTINLRIIGNRLRLYYLDSEQKVIDPQFQMALVRFENVSRKEVEGVLTLKLASDETGNYLTSPRFMRPPTSYWLTITMKDPNNTDKTVFLGRHRLSQQ